MASKFEWKVDSPESHPLSGETLDQLWEGLAEKESKTKAADAVVIYAICSFLPAVWWASSGLSV